MHSYGIVINHIRQRKRIELWLVLSTVGFLSLTLFSCYRYQSFRESQPTWRLWVVYFSYDMQQGILTALVSNYIFSIFILSDRFEKLNTSLEWANMRHSLVHIYHIPAILGLNFFAPHVNTCTNTDENTNIPITIDCSNFISNKKGHIRGNILTVPEIYDQTKVDWAHWVCQAHCTTTRSTVLHHGWHQLLLLMPSNCAQRISGCYSWFESDPKYSLNAPTRLWWYWPLISFSLW